MKQVSFYYKAILTFITLTYLNVIAVAQETTSGNTSTTKVEITTDTGNWFSNNWLWVVGVIVFIILLFALMGSSGSSRRTTVVREDPLTGTTRSTTVDEDI
jgi:hypothetical protein